MRTKVRLTPQNVSSQLNAKIASSDIQNFNMLVGAEVGVRSTQGQTTEEVDTEDRVSYRIYCSLSVRAAVLHKAG